LTDSSEPECYEEAVQVETRKKWEQAMKEEMDSLAHNQTWDLVRLLVGKTALQNKWVYRLKEEDGGKQRYKARLVVKGFAQKKGIDFNEIFSPVVKMTSIKIILSIVAVEDFHLEQLDVKTTFLHGDLEEEIYASTIRIFVRENEILDVLKVCHSEPCGGHFKNKRNTYKVLCIRYYCSSLFKDAKKFVSSRNACKRMGRLVPSDEMPLQT